MGPVQGRVRHVRPAELEVRHSCSDIVDLGKGCIPLEVVVRRVAELAADTVADLNSGWMVQRSCSAEMEGRQSVGLVEPG